MSDINSKTFLFQTGTTHNGWLPVYTEVSVQAADLCSCCEGFGSYDVNIPDCEACDGRGHTLAPEALAALARAQKGATV